MNNFHLIRSLRRLAFCFSAIFPLLAYGAGLGNLNVYSYIGQPLNGEIKLVASPDEIAGLSAQIAEPAFFERAGIAYSASAGKIRASVAKRRDGVLVVRLSSTVPINDPYVELLVELAWPQGKVVRQYAFLLDPPEAAAKNNASESATSEYAPSVPAEKAPVPPASGEDQGATSPSVAAPEKNAEVDLSAPEQGQEKAVTEKVTPSKDKKIISGKQSSRSSASEREIVVGKGDSLYGVASQVSAPDDVTLDQIVVALYRANKRQFINGNMNLIGAGKVLTIPDDDEFSEVSAREARRIIQAQTDDFRSYQSSVGGALAVSGVRGATSSAAGKFGGNVVDQQAKIVGGGDRLQVAQASPGGKISNSLKEELASKTRALQEAQSRINELEKTVQSQSKLLNLQGGSSLKSGAQLKSSVTPAQPLLTPTTADKPPVSSTVGSGVTSQTSGTGISSPQSVTTVSPPVQPKPRPRPAPPPPKGFFESMFDEQPTLVYGGLLLVLVVLAYFGFRFYRNRSAQSAGHVVEEIVEEPSPAPRRKKPMATKQEKEPKKQEISVDEGFMDPLAEAESYRAFGREEQAIQILQEVLAKEPHKVDYQFKLLEIYAQLKDKNRFNELAMDLRASTSGQGEIWKSVVALGKSVDPNNTLFGAPAKTSATDLHKGAGAIVSAPTVTTTMQSPGEFSRMAEQASRSPQPPSVVETLIGEKLPKVEEDAELQLHTTAPTPPVEAAPLAAPADLDTDLDFGSADEGDSFDLDLTTQTTTQSAELQADVLNLDEKDAEPASLDLDIDFDSMSKPFMEGEAAPIDFDISSTMGLQMGTDTPRDEPPKPSAQPPLQAEPHKNAQDDALDLEASIGMMIPDISLDLGPAVPKILGNTYPQSKDEEMIPMLPLDALADNKTPPPHASEKLEARDIEPLSISIDPVKAKEGSSQNTKLELAKAYEAMGNKEGARELLQEVLKGGSPEHQKLAQSLLAKL